MRICEHCGCYLDSNEKCDCRSPAVLRQKEREKKSRRKRIEEQKSLNIEVEEIKDVVKREKHSFGEVLTYSNGSTAVILIS